MNIIMSRALPHHYPHRPPPAPQPAILASKASTPTSPLDFTDRIPYEELTLSSETLGSGSFGTVFKGYWRKKRVAVKQFKTREEIDSFLVEVKQLSCVKHKNIVTLYGASTSSDTAYLVMECAPGGSLNHLLHECRYTQVYDLRHACSWAMQTAQGVAYLHGIRPKPIMHRDLKPANLLLFDNGKTLKICDFGTACAVKTQMTNNTGSASYMAPEVFATSSYLESGDVFSWGIIFWEILVRTQPYSYQKYSNPYQILWRVNQGTRPDEIEDCPKPIWNLITNSWDKDPRSRPTMQSVAEEMKFIFRMTSRQTIGTTRANSNSTTPTSVIAACDPIKTGAGISSGNRFNMMITNDEATSSTDQRGSGNNSPQQQVHLMRPRWFPPHGGLQLQQASSSSISTSISSTSTSASSAADAAAVRRQTAEMNSNHHYQNHQYLLHQQHQYHHQEQQHQQQQSSSSIHSQTRLSNQRKALIHHLGQLHRRTRQLEGELKCDRKNSESESFKEYEELKSDINGRRAIRGIEHVSSRSSASSTPSSPQQPPNRPQISTAGAVSANNIES